MLKLEKTYLKATSDQRSAGLAWYREAHNYAIELSSKHGCSVPVACGVLAALSPNNKWGQNKKDADRFLAVPSMETKVSTYPAQRAKAMKIMMSHSGDIPAILSGPKTQAFYENILDPYKSQAVTVDLWILRIIGKKTATKKVYRETTDRIRKLAAKHGVSPLEFQATIWGVVRDENTLN